MVLGEVTGSFGFVMEHATGPEREVLLKIRDQTHPLCTRHKYVEYKIRCKRVKAGFPFMQMNKPHFDTVRDALGVEASRTTPEIHHLWTTPPGPIFFCANPQMEVIKHRPKPGHILTYGRYSLHQTPFMDEDTTRLLIRATQSDIIDPRNIKKGR